jgi:uncharacterized Tic20 family protein
MNSQTIYGVSGFGDVHEGEVVPPPPPAPPAPSQTGAEDGAAPSGSDRIAALIAHGGTFFAWFLAPAVVYLLKRNESRYAEFQALQALLWSLTGTIVAAATCGLAIPVFMVFHGIAAYKTLCGEPYEYPFVGRIAKNLMA